MKLKQTKELTSNSSLIRPTSTWLIWFNCKITGRNNNKSFMCISPKTDKYISTLVQLKQLAGLWQIISGTPVCVLYCYSSSAKCCSIWSQITHTYPEENSLHKQPFINVSFQSYLKAPSAQNMINIWQSMDSYALYSLFTMPQEVVGSECHLRVSSLFLSSCRVPAVSATRMRWW